MSRHSRRPARWLLLSIGVTLLVGGTGCAATLISYTGTEEHALYLPKSRAEVIEQFGQPDKEETLPEDGLTIDTYRLRKKLGTDSASSKLFAWCNNCGQAPLLWPMLTILTYGAPEAILAGVVLYQSIRDGYHIAFVFDQDGQIVLRYLLDTAPADRFVEVRRQLAQRLWVDLENTPAPLAPSIDAHGATLHRWAQRLDYSVSSEVEEALQTALQLSRNADEERLSREETLIWLRACSSYNPVAC